ncbi:hypothetical protein BDP27DRAFT_1214682 [Rhodocollybia butyracea]|uniref:MYND-type domain-containing protein n=1 Tax=Rhodocollybia butyracea TaxID=206335 RepID=A0A9P5Q2A8_9AGAR|nr:hypothetical protein BDP27DRAFT_1214682 [Rhodocollybia butyracea]
MKRILQQPRKYLRAMQDKGQQLRNLYVNGSATFDPRRLSKFGQYCYLGRLNEVKMLVESNSVPDIKGKETAYEWGYASLIIVGAQRTPNLKSTQHEETLAYILEHGAPVDSEDIVGTTALQNVFNCSVELPTNLLRVLLTHGANPNHQNRYGGTAIIPAFMRNYTAGIDVLMEFGADLDIAEADGITPRKFYINCGPQVAAVIGKWMRRRAGEPALPREGGTKRCGACSKSADAIALRSCSRCKVERYCSPECQKKAWPIHRKTCTPFNATTTVTLKPSFALPDGSKDLTNVPVASIARAQLGFTKEENIPEREYRSFNVPESFNKPLVIKVQISAGASAGKRDGTSDMMVYTKKRDLACRILYREQLDATMKTGFDKVVEVVMSKGMEGKKAYFAAELKTRDALVIKVSEVLAEQPF